MTCRYEARRVRLAGLSHGGRVGVWQTRRWGTKVAPNPACQDLGGMSAAGLRLILLVVRPRGGDVVDDFSRYING
jgi:hypothetical protein